MNILKKLVILIRILAGCILSETTHGQDIDITSVERDTSQIDWHTLSTGIPLSSPIYDDLNQLSGLKGFDFLYSGERPLSRSHVSALISKVQSKIHTDPYLNNTFFKTYLDGLDQRYGSGSQGGRPAGRFRFRSLNVHYLWLNQPGRIIPETSGILIPFLSNREGRVFDADHNIAVEGSADFQLSSFAVLGTEVRWRQGSNTDQPGQLGLRRLYLKLRLKAVEFQLGRDSLTWGHGFSGSLGLSSNAKPFEFIKISNWKTTLLPWYFKYLGPFNYQVFFARLDKDRLDFPNPFLFSIHIQSKPTSWFEISAYRWMLLGGTGSSSSGFNEFITDLIMYRVGDFQNRSKINNAGGVNLKFRLPFFNGMFIYSDTYWEDVGRAAKNGVISLIHFPFQPNRFSKENANKSGVSIPNLLAHGRLSLDLEQVISARIIYRHGIYTSGYTHEQRLLGHDLGPGGHAGYMKMSSQVTPRFRLHFFAALERRGDEGQNPADLIVLRKNPTHARAEWRYRLMPGFLWRMKSNQSLIGQVGYERVHHFNYIHRDDRHNTLFELKLQRLF